MTTCYTAPGDLMRLVATGLTDCGFDVGYPEHADERRLTITAPPGMRCALTVEDWGEVELNYWSTPGHYAEPTQITSMALTVLAPGDHSLPDPPGRALSWDALRRGVGGVLKAAGLNVDLDVCADRDTFDVTVELVAASPGHPERGQIRISDDGHLTWACGYDPSTVPGPAITETMADILTRELGQAGGSGSKSGN